MKLQIKMMATILSALSIAWTATTAAGADRVQETPLQNKLQPFQSDGCSRFPDGVPYFKKTLWRKCCVLHDIAYWQGGTAEQRLQADKDLGQCVERSGAGLIGKAMFVGVRAGGMEESATTWHWGYGWTINRGYAPLQPHENEQVQSLLNEIPADLDRLPLHAFTIVRKRQSLTGNNSLDLAVVQVQKALGRSFKIEELNETDQEKSDGLWKTLLLQIAGCEAPFVFTFQLLNKRANTEQMDELTARGRIRLLRKTLPVERCH